MHLPPIGGLPWQHAADLDAQRLMQLRASLQQAGDSNGQLRIHLLLNFLVHFPMTPQLLFHSQMARVVRPLTEHEHPDIAHAASYVLWQWKGLVAEHAQALQRQAQAKRAKQAAAKPARRGGSAPSRQRAAQQQGGPSSKRRKVQQGPAQRPPAASGAPKGAASALPPGWQHFPAQQAQQQQQEEEEEEALLPPSKKFQLQSVQLAGRAGTAGGQGQRARAGDLARMDSGNDSSLAAGSAPETVTEEEEAPLAGRWRSGPGQGSGGGQSLGRFGKSGGQLSRFKLVKGQSGQQVLGHNGAGAAAAGGAAPLSSQAGCDACGGAGSGAGAGAPLVSAAELATACNLPLPSVLQGHLRQPSLLPVTCG